jgi:hypothetical protein
LRIAGRGLFRKPMLHIPAGARTFEDQISHSTANLTATGFSVLISVNVKACRLCQRAPIPGDLTKRAPDCLSPWLNLNVAASARAVRQ